MKKVNFILLAAGSSSRMGHDKALLNYKGQPWLYEQAKQIRDSGLVDHLVVVCQPLKKEIYQDTLALLAHSDFQFQIVSNPDPLSKPSDSIRCGLKEFDFSAGSFISPIDVPMASSVLKALLKNNPAKVIRPTFQARPGHPVWISGDLLDSFLAADTRLDDFLRSSISVESNVEVDSAEVLLNLNTPEAWDQWINR